VQENESGKHQLPSDNTVLYKPAPMAMLEKAFGSARNKR